MNKIDIRDLRVGDLIYYGNCKANMDGDYNVEFEARQLTLDDFKFFTDNDWNDLDFDEFLKPIPLTSKILENSGFVKRQPKIGENKNCLGTWFNSKTVTTVKEYFIDREHSIFVLFGGYSKIGNIKFVHQFQNALRDCGIDKKITF